MDKYGRPVWLLLLLASTMIKSTLSFIAILSLLGATSAFAKTLKLPGD